MHFDLSEKGFHKRSETVTWRREHTAEVPYALTVEHTTKYNNWYKTAAHSGHISSYGSDDVNTWAGYGRRVTYNYFDLVEWRRSASLFSPVPPAPTSMFRYTLDVSTRTERNEKKCKPEELWKPLDGVYECSTFEELLEAATAWIHEHLIEERAKKLNQLGDINT